MSSKQSEITPLTIIYGNKENQIHVGFYEVEEKDKDGKALKKKLVEKSEGSYEWQNYCGKTLFIYIKPVGDNFSETRRPAKQKLKEDGTFIHEKELYKKAYELFLEGPKEQNEVLNEKNKEIEELRKQLEEQQEKAKKEKK